MKICLETHHQQIVLLSTLHCGCGLGVVETHHTIHHKLVLVPPARDVQLNLIVSGLVELTNV